MSLSQQQLDQYAQDGFLILPAFFSAAELEGVIEEVNGLVDRLARENLVERERSANDRRWVDLRLSPGGRQVLARPRQRTAGSCNASGRS